MNRATESLEITSKSYKEDNEYTSRRSIAEYIWNGFGAHAKEVRYTYNYNI